MKIIGLLFLLFAFVISVNGQVKKERTALPLPTQAQLNWQNAELAVGSCIGYKRIEEIGTTEAAELRLLIENTLAIPVITDFSVYSYWFSKLEKYVAFNSFKTLI